MWQHGSTFQFGIMNTILVQIGDVRVSFKQHVSTDVFPQRRHRQHSSLPSPMRLPSPPPTPPDPSSTFSGWMHILIALTLGCFFSRTVLLIYLGIMSTLLLPPKPVLWTAFCQSPVFRTWREYFNFS